MIEKVRLLTKSEYDEMTPFRQGYATYMQAEWPGAVIPKGNPYPVGSTDGEQWFRGNYQAMIETQDVDD